MTPFPSFGTATPRGLLERGENIRGPAREKATNVHAVQYALPNIYTPPCVYICSVELLWRRHQRHYAHPATCPSWRLNVARAPWPFVRHSRSPCSFRGPQFARDVASYYGDAATFAHETVAGLQRPRAAAYAHRARPLHHFIYAHALRGRGRYYNLALCPLTILCALSYLGRSRSTLLRFGDSVFATTAHM